MSYEDRNTDSISSGNHGDGPGPEVMGANTLIGDEVYNQKEENLGSIKEIMLDTHSGNVCYAVLSCGGFLGMGEKLFAVPWSALKLDAENKRFMLNVEADRLKNAPGFDKDQWPNMADSAWAQNIHSYYGTQSDATRPNIPHL
ncbi:MAG: PRC-barrel domain-containing protein [Candidatus Competibacteraceae bacterium]|uniref:PRC-barrel domain protein n=1 Tax=Candidatus Contendobacter odensis Run_B_J11 TaxID=1400861 RepID=A0A7U7J4Z3_9GAMM|nr:PRC-barrel domain-containing protein [Candidatus Contendobacter odensis]MBK8538182.1 PRC-barrel domain-containing protein [Candidatus Competibacteraceae bacterium]MBK8752724.1 PRC-barrel domain-containing protein [Candidatus Competibacteraceae bacterium]CDH46175.1 PRC-barrel domain protein [Candidatus Contendobacter odensis Run_B_J11]